MQPVSTTKSQPSVCVYVCESLRLCASVCMCLCVWVFPSAPYVSRTGALGTPGWMRALSATSWNVGLWGEARRSPHQGRAGAPDDSGTERASAEPRDSPDVTWALGLSQDTRALLRTWSEDCVKC